MSRILVGPFGRVEGDLEVTLETEGGRVTSARVSAGLYRGFERILLGRAALDALVIAPRICGLCSVSHSVAAARALARAMGAPPMPANGSRVVNLIEAVENAADAVTHFYLFFMPDFAREVYQGAPWAEAAARFAVGGAGQGEALAARARFIQAMGLLAGKWPHSLTIQPGGSARPVTAGEKLRLTAILREFRGFLERRLFADRLEAVAEIDTVAGLETWADGKKDGDFPLFLKIANGIGLDAVGRAYDRFVAAGSFPDGEGGWLFAPGVAEGEALGPFDPAWVVEDVAHAWLTDQSAGPPMTTDTVPDADKAGGYSWSKAPRLAGQPAEVGAFARQVVDGHPLARDLLAREGASVRARIAARMIELARLLPAMERWVAAIEAAAPFFAPGGVAADGDGVGLVEAARGLLGHWVRIEDGRIAGYQIVSPTTWNFSPRDRDGVPGPLERALVGVAVAAGETAPVAVQHVVRSFDPCLACTVH